ncbi:unnamed protein product [Orchesella dallaii]|uniref:Uncharacterized protein n=1 Tax=Orchesella dallaii TaxID=48710 RepID=A0ABP1PW94_9HEXA
MFCNFLNLLELIVKLQINSYPIQYGSHLNHNGINVKKITLFRGEVFLNGQGERMSALRNCRLLKDKEEYKGISVKPDETLQQRLRSRQSSDGRIILTAKRGRMGENRDTQVYKQAKQSGASNSSILDTDNDEDSSQVMEVSSDAVTTQE